MLHALLLILLVTASNEHLGFKRSEAMARFLPPEYHNVEFCTALYDMGMRELVSYRWERHMTLEQFNAEPYNPGTTIQQAAFIDQLAIEAWSWQQDPDSWMLFEFNECIKPRPVEQES